MSNRDPYSDSLIGPEPRVRRKQKLRVVGKALPVELDSARPAKHSTWLPIRLPGCALRGRRSKLPLDTIYGRL
jgi:hypothetical protein